MKLYKTNNLDIKSGIFQMILMGLIIAIVINPSIAINSAKEGLYLWFNILLPSLLPFLILAELFISSGFVESFGRLLGPIMKPVFKVPGLGAFPLLMSIISGYPVGAKLTSDLRASKLLNKAEANRLITFTSTSGPLFILGSVLIGMLNLPQFSLLMILPHYLGIITVGLFFRFYKSPSLKFYNPKGLNKIDKGGIQKTKPKYHIASLISSSVREGMNSILLIGGFVVIYSVIIDLLLMSQLVKQFIMIISAYSGASPQLIEGVFAGFIELTTGCKKVSMVNMNPAYKIIIINFLIAWGGLSILSQALSFISQTDISSKLYIFSKFLHGVFSGIYTYLIYLFKFKNITIPSSLDIFIASDQYGMNNWIYSFFNSGKLAIGICLYFIILSLFIHELWLKEE